MTQPAIFTVITSQTNIVTGVANTGISTQQGGTVFGAVIGTAQVGQTVLDAAATLGKVETRFIPGVGTALAIGATIDSGRSIQKSLDKGEAVNQADIASIVSNVAAGVGSAIVLFGASGPIVVTLGVIAVGAGVYQLVAAAKGLTVEGVGVDLTATQRAQVDTQVAQALPLLNTPQSIEFFNIPAGSTFKVDTSAFLNPQTVRDFSVAAPSDPARAASSTFLTTNDAHSVTLNPGAVLSDVVATENAKGNAITLKDLLANNPNITNQDNVRAGLTVQIPERTSGNLTLNYGQGVTITTDLTGGEYHMVVPNADGGNTIYSRVADDSGYTIRQISTNRDGKTTYDFTGVQATQTSDIKPLSVLENTDAFSRTTTAQGDLGGVYTEVNRTFDPQGNLTSTATTGRATVGGELTTTVESKVDGNDISVTYGYDANKAPVVQSLNSINGQPVDVATSDAFVLQANSQNTNASPQDPVLLTQSLSQAILPTLNINVNNVDTAVSTTVGTTAAVETVTLTDGSSVNLTSSNQYVSTTAAPPADSAIAIDVPVSPTPATGNTTPSTLIINGVTVTDNGDGTYLYSLPTAAGGSETVGDSGNGSAVVNNYTASGRITGSETTGFDANGGYLVTNTTPPPAPPAFGSAVLGWDQGTDGYAINATGYRGGIHTPDGTYVVVNQTPAAAVSLIDVSSEYYYFSSWLRLYLLGYGTKLLSKMASNEDFERLAA